jgi:hypothetical protein
MEDQHIGLEGIEVGLRGLDQDLRGVSADGAVLDDQVGVGIGGAQVPLQFLPPDLLGDRLTVEEDAYRFSVRRRAAEQRQGTAQVLALLGVGLLGRRRRIGDGRAKRAIPEQADASQTECNGCVQSHAS